MNLNQVALKQSSLKELLKQDTPAKQETAKSADFLQALKTEIGAFPAAPAEAPRTEQKIESMPEKPAFEKNERTSPDNMESSRVRTTENREPEKTEKNATEARNEKKPEKTAESNSSPATRAESAEQKSANISKSPLTIEPAAMFRKENPLTGIKTAETDVKTKKNSKKDGSPESLPEALAALMAQARKAFQDLKPAAEGPHTEGRQAAAQGRSGQEQVRTALHKLQTLLERLNLKSMKPEEAGQLKTALAGFREAIERLGFDSRRTDSRKDVKAEAGIRELKDLPVKIETLLGSMKQEKPQGQGADRNFSQAFGLEFDRTRSAARSADQSGASQKTAFREQLQGIIENARIVVRDGQNGSFTVKLFPRDLGSLNINLGLENGVIHGRFLVDTVEAKELVQANLPQIRQQLEDAGIMVGEFHVNVSDNNQRFFSEGGDRQEMPAIAAAFDAEKSAEYEYNAAPAYTGSVNIII